MSTQAVRAHEEKYRAQTRSPEAIARRIVSRYAGVDVLEVARIESLPPFAVRGIRARAGRCVDDGHPLQAAGWREQLSFEDLDKMMRRNRGARAA